MFMDIQNIVSMEGLKSTTKNFATPFNYVFLILLIVKSFEILLKHSG